MSDTDNRRIIYPDLEFLPRMPGNRGTHAIGIVDDAGEEFYRINADFDLYALSLLTHHPDVQWYVDNVIPFLPVDPQTLKWDTDHPDYVYVQPAKQIAQNLEDWLTPDAARGIRAVGYYGAGDITRIHQLWNSNWGTMPTVIPRRMPDLADWADALGIQLPGVEAGAGQPHHALSDARHHRTLHRSLIGRTVTIL